MLFESLIPSEILGPTLFPFMLGQYINQHMEILVAAILKKF